ncbi:Uma2 family endonuclease [Streptomyces sp. NPDC059853]|uniref:Uma2 family endonuclease n=1 Tax=Streptomyces sp. NPDC059853 TaxID=3346973 RepID=UPI003656C5B0
MTAVLERSTPVVADDIVPGEFEDLLRILQDLDTPDGCKAEIIKGAIVVTPWQRPYYFRAMESLRERLAPHAPEGHRVSSSPFLFAFPAAKRAFGPDLYAADSAAFEQLQGPVNGAALSLVAELTSPSTREQDVQDKLAVYGRHVPVYLLLDMQDEEATVFWEVSPNGYRAYRSVPFGQPLRIPEPFGFDLDTSDFGRPAGGPGR